jgi:flagellar M-ring protein FliF
MMDQFQKIYAALSVRQRLSLLLAAVAVLGGLWWLNQWNRERDFRPLYSNLSPEDAAAIMAKLKESGVPYRLNDSGTAVAVPSAKAAELRLQLAAAGLPKSGRIGYELFDKTTLGQTEFAEHINYRRAVEGELERSITALREVESARVHVTFPKDSVFAESREPAKASVLLRLRKPARLEPANIKAITHLVASAVEGLKPEQVSVVDDQGNLLSVQPAGPDQADAEQAELMLRYRQRIEKGISEKLQQTLDPLLGARRYRTGVTVDCDLTSGEQSEENFDPNRSVMITAQRSEDSGTGVSTGGQPGTASNLPRPPARPAPGGSTLSRRTENLAFQTSRTVRRMKLPQGTVKRISVSVVLDQDLRWEMENGKAKRILDPPAPERLKAVKDLVSGAAGLDPARGDVLVVESLAFEETLRQGPPAALAPAPKAAPGTAAAPAAEWWGLPPRILMLAGAGAGVVVLLGGLVWFWRRRRKGPRAAKVTVTDSLAPGAAPKQLAPHNEPGAEGTALPAPKQDDSERQAREILSQISLPENRTKKAEVLIKHITDEVKKDPGKVAQILRAWIAAQDEVR